MLTKKISAKEADYVDEGQKVSLISSNQIKTFQD